ncbi:MAG: hypothetical protein HP048_04355 [Clostridia bacterium]|nr:hypothetical protein [Clostridia bacterium]
MKNLWKKISLILAGAVVVLFFSNDFGLIDVEKTAIITAIGVDLAESGNFELTVQIAVPQVSSSQSENKKAIVSCEGDTVSFALHEVGTRTGWYPKLSFCNLIVLGEKMLNEGDVTAIVEYFARTVKIQDSAILTACEDTAKELLQVSTPLDNLSAFALQKILIKNPGRPTTCLRRISNSSPSACTLRAALPSSPTSGKSPLTEIRAIRPAARRRAAAPPKAVSPRTVIRNREGPPRAETWTAAAEPRPKNSYSTPPRPCSSTAARPSASWTAI